jgi:hypothetical protein
MFACATVAQSEDVDLAQDGVVVSTVLRIIATSDGHVWAQTGPRGPFQEWDGAQWTTHELPATSQVIYDLVADNRGGLWALGRDIGWRWRPNERDWEQFASFRAALEQYLRADAKFALTNSGDGPINQTGAVPPPPDFRIVSETVQTAARGGGEPIPDRDGSYWFMRDQKLWRARGGLCVPFLFADEALLFITDPIGSVAIDRAGNVFLVTRHTQRCFFCAARKPRPRTKIDIAVEGDSVRAHFAAAPECPHCFVWRVNGSPWSEPTTDANLTMKFLPNGPYRLEARAIDDDLQIDFEPATAECTIAVDRAAEVAREIARLRDKDFSERTDAVIRLPREWERALPALRRQRAQTTDDGERWWIEAAIQEAERAEASNRSSRK